jgi:hypothetical protein
MKTSRENEHRRFFGNGNWSDAERRHRGWQVVCVHCGKQSKPVVTSHHKPVPPEEIAHRFARQGWFVGKYADEDACQSCQEKTRTETRKQNLVHERNVQSVKHLRETITKLDRFLTDNVAMCSGPEFMADQGDLIQVFGSLLDTAFICNLMPPKWQEQPVPYSRVGHLDKLWHVVTEEERQAFLARIGADAMEMALELSEPPTAAPMPKAPAEPPPAALAAAHVSEERALNELKELCTALENDVERLRARHEELQNEKKRLLLEIKVDAAVPQPLPAAPPSPQPPPQQPLAKSNISPKMAELRDRARRQLNGAHQ